MMTDKNTKNEIYQEYTIFLKRAADDSIEVPDDIYGLTIRDTKAVLLEAVEHISRLINKSDEKRNNQNENEFFQTSDQAEQNKNNSSNDNYHSSKDYNQESEYKQAGVMSTSSVRAGAKVQYFSLGNSLGIIAPEIIDKIKAVEDIVNPELFMKP